MQLFGRGGGATHLLSVVFALAAVPVAYWAAAGIAGRLAGVYAAVLTAGLPFLVTYAQETRMYSLILLLSLVVAGAFVRAFVLGRRRWAPVFSVALAAALYTHNWALFLDSRPRWPRWAGASGRGRPTSAAGWPATVRWASRARPSCTCRGPPPCSTRRPTPALRGRPRPPSGR